MATDKLRIQVYVEPELYQKLIEWKEEQGISHISEALNQVMIEKFWAPSQSLSNPQSTEDIEKIVRAEVSSLFRIQMEENVDFWLNRLSERVANVEQSLEKFVSLSHRQIDELKDDLGERLAACEDSLERLTGNSSGELPSESPNELTPFTPGATIADENDSYGIVIGINNLGMSVDWVGIGTCPNPPAGKGVWYDWTKATQAIASFKPATHDRINLLTTEELLEVLAWTKGQLEDYWDGKWFDTRAHSIRWGGATINRWIAVVQSDSPSELPSELNLTQLAQRLNISKSVMSSRKTRPDFQEWSKGKDPDAIAWRYDRKKQKFFPVEDRA